MCKWSGRNYRFTTNHKVILDSITLIHYTSVPRNSKFMQLSSLLLIHLLWKRYTSVLRWSSWIRPYGKCKRVITNIPSYLFKHLWLVDFVYTTSHGQLRNPSTLRKVVKPTATCWLFLVPIVKSLMLSYILHCYTMKLVQQDNRS